MSIDSPVRKDEALARSMAAKHVYRPDISLIREDLYCVLSPEYTLGYVEKVGPVFVALRGEDTAHAVEVGQSLSWDAAVAMVVRSVKSRGAAQHSRSGSSSSSGV